MQQLISQLCVLVGALLQSWERELIELIQQNIETYVDALRVKEDKSSPSFFLVLRLRSIIFPYVTQRCLDMVWRQLLFQQVKSLAQGIKPEQQ